MNSEERQQNYREHRLRIQNATSLVNSQAPKPKPKIDKVEKKLSSIELMYNLMSHSKSAKDPPTPLQTNLDKKLRRKRQEFAIPFHTIQRYDHLEFMRDWSLMKKLLRPNIFLELTCNNQQPLGRLGIQLFTEACPEVVLQFVRTCLAQTCDRINITRIFFPLWLEAELLLNDKNALTSKNMEHDALAVNHGRYPYVLSFPSRYLRGNKFRSITFTMSFTPIDVLNGKRIAFGIVTSGHKTLERLQSFEVTRSGKPCQTIAVSACGFGEV